MATENSDFWKGFHEALSLVSQQIDIFLATGYNEARTRDELLDLKCHINELRDMSGSLNDLTRSLSG
jgi:hypothetical protein